jgi:antitoxin component of RelBE/YafQ-DinJ toxin-antitoxin module
LAAPIAAALTAILESMGMDMSAPVVGFLSYIAAFMALPFALFVLLASGSGAQGRG